MPPIQRKHLPSWLSSLAENAWVHAVWLSWQLCHSPTCQWTSCAQSTLHSSPSPCADRWLGQLMSQRRRQMIVATWYANKCRRSSSQRDGKPPTGAANKNTLEKYFHLPTKCHSMISRSVTLPLRQKHLPPHLVCCSLAPGSSLQSCRPASP